MERTRTRPLPDGRLAPLEALLFGCATTAGGLAVLAIGAGRLAAVVTAATFVLYVFAYTPLKLRTPLCTLVGAVPGALPPVTGWAAARDDVAVGAWVLFGIMFLWQLPHTLAIARLYQADYARAGVRVLPVVDAQGGSTERQILSGCLGAARGEPAADPDRPGRRRVLRRRARARRHLRRVRRAAGDGALRARARAACCWRRSSTCRCSSRCWPSTRHEHRDVRPPGAQSLGPAHHPHRGGRARGAPRSWWGSAGDR